MANTIEEIGIVKNIDGNHLSIQIVQTSACASCSAKGHCTSAESKDHIIDVYDASASLYQIGEKVCITAKTSMGLWAVMIAFVIPLVLLVSSIFILMSYNHNELYASLFGLLVLFPYYLLLYLNRTHLKRKLYFTIKQKNYKQL